MSENLEISKTTYLKLLQKIYGNKLEERDLALDRYRKADEQMESIEHFVLMGKTAVSFLNLASLSTNDLASLAKEIKSIVYKDDSGSEVTFSLGSDWKDAIQESISDAEQRNVSRNIDMNEGD